MTCYSPLKGFRGPFNKNGKQPLVFSRESARSRVPVSQGIPCGQCIGCRLKHSRCWAVRCVHEASLHSRNCFITLTYDNNHLPSDYSLNVRHFQLFMKRLRKMFGNDIRFFHAGEYGEKYGRPHYHAILFGIDFNDRKLLKYSSSGFAIYTSEVLSDLWGKGYVSVADVSFSSAAYIARYVVKKMNGKNTDDHYSTFDSDTGEISLLKKEYATMSRKPGIAADWIDKYMIGVYARDSVIVKTPKGYKEYGPPRYYDKLYEKKYGSEAFLRLKSKRFDKNKDLIERRKQMDDEAYYKRLLSEETCKMRDIERLFRNLEDDLVE